MGVCGPVNGGGSFFVLAQGIAMASASPTDRSVSEARDCLQRGEYRQYIETMNSPEQKAQDVENIEKELFDYAVKTVFSEPQLDIASESVDTEGAAATFAVEFLPGQFDQRADSAAQCIQIISQGERPRVKTAKVYILEGNISEKEIAEIYRAYNKFFKENPDWSLFMITTDKEVENKEPATAYGIDNKSV